MIIFICGIAKKVTCEFSTETIEEIVRIIQHRQFSKIDQLKGTFANRHTLFNNGFSLKIKKTVPLKKNFYKHCTQSHEHIYRQLLEKI